ncbi:ParB/RepB/Spo0J family partition protein [Sulfuricurvum sp.]|uniref:ParB/RepB/Spo0J family partition protein n=1 Tax=Sulfuricurvum sp. TaxID=2025608 RepID=UPI002635ACC9|nr:ParB/RepB/Spo0J family partition protein [Sulfuricurvum sp.]MDD2266431.1 ParB/RepB/Spo0J family partition protein [Sulfuricurvum sp.]MDD2785015.1 ParB/RepB/Spo0J family partition protein [Sulfuricurvum sp.]HZF69862.1 ParB/RepB/Spo0J family partition protein [Sulfuricurvum sp.]
MAKASALGRGLGALLSEIEEAYDNELPKRGGVEEISLSKIRPNPYQPRKHFDPESLAELAESIKTHGLLQPIVIKEDLDGFILIAGERRLRASKLAKNKTIKAIVVNVSDEQMRQQALIENIQRDELNAIDLAQAYQELIDIHELTHEQLSQTVHKSRTQITNTLRLLQLSEKGRKALVEGKITAGHAKVIIGLEPNEQTMMIDSIIGQKLSVRDVESMVKKIKLPSPTSQDSHTAEGLNFTSVKKHLQMLGYKCSTKGYKMTIEFEDNDQIESFLDLLS